MVDPPSLQAGVLGWSHERDATTARASRARLLSVRTLFIRALAAVRAAATAAATDESLSVVPLGLQKCHSECLSLSGTVRESADGLSLVRRVQNENRPGRAPKSCDRGALFVGTPGAHGRYHLAAEVA